MRYTIIKRKAKTLKCEEFNVWQLKLKNLSFENAEQEIGLVGPQDSQLKLIEEGLTVTLSVLGDQLTIKGDADKVAAAYSVVSALTSLIRRGVKIGPADIVSAINMAERGTIEYFEDMYTETLLRDVKGRPVRVKNYGQRRYIQAIRQNDITFGIGPAGTGKTYLAVVMAVAAMKRGDALISRPAVRRRCPALPGDLKEKLTLFTSIMMH